MTKAKVLAGLAFVLFSFLSYYGWLTAINGGSRLWYVVGGLSTLFSLSGAALSLLTLVAVAPAPDGAFVIKSDSFYGKVFLFVSSLSRSEFSMCKAFWKTNLMLVLGSVMAAMVAAIAFVVIELIHQMGIMQILLGFGGVALIIGALIGLAAGIDKVSEMTSSNTFAGFALLIVAVVLFFAAKSVGIIKFLLTGLAVVGGFAAIVGIVFLATYTFTSLSQTQFGQTIGTWKEKLCPRFRIEYS